MTSRKITIPTPVCQLRQWQHNPHQRSVFGFVYDSKDPMHYTDGEMFLIQNYKYISHYPAAKGNDGSYYLVTQSTGKTFKLRTEDMKNVVDV